MSEFVLQLHDVDDVGKEFRFPLTSGWLDSALSDTPLRRDPAAPEGSLVVRAQRNDGEILIDGRVQADLVTDCSRCLGDAALPVDTRMTALLSQGADESLPQEVELEPEDLDRARFEGNELILDELVREHLLLECPMKVLCSDDCRGIELPSQVRPRPEDFGGEGAVDPRLSPLLDIKAKLSGDASQDQEDSDDRVRGEKE